MEQHLSVFRESFLLACRNVGDSYFNFEMAGTDGARQLERVYCYELYHQFRNILPDNFPFLLQNEVDKIGHRIIQGSDKPDFLFHLPGSMNNESNLVIIEVKRAKSSIGDIESDFNKLKKFTDEYNYHLGIALIFGTFTEGKKQQIIDKYNQCCDDCFDKVKLFFHEGVGQSAVEHFQDI